MGFWEFSCGIAVLLSLILDVLFSEFPGWFPNTAKSPGGKWEKGIGKGERHKVCENLFWKFGRRMVGKKEKPTPFFDRLSRFFGH